MPDALKAVAMKSIVDPKVKSKKTSLERYVSSIQMTF
jgi:hypothetical protein